MNAASGGGGSGDERTVRCSTCGRFAGPGHRACPWCGAALPLDTRAFASGQVGPGTTVDFGWGVATLDRQLGEGGMGAVHHAWIAPRAAVGVARPVEAAVKVLHPTFGAQQRFRELFANEARVLASLAHPCVVRFLGIGEVAGTSAIAMEFVPGETLGSLIERKVAQARSAAKSPQLRALLCLPFERAWHYFQQLLGALAATHALGIVHRDVKPENVLLRLDGVAKLTDFGIARAPSAESGKMVAGTVAYMSPEQVQGEPLDGRSDLYSAGVVLFEMLTGRLPFPTEDRSEWLVACDHVQTPPPRLRTLLPQAPVELEMLVERALAKRREERFASALALGDAFRLTLGLPLDAGWFAQQRLAQQAVRWAGGTLAANAPELAAARAAISAAYGARG